MHRLIKMYDDPVFFARDRDAYFEYSYSSHREDDAARSPSLDAQGDGAKSFRRKLENDMGISYRRIHSRLSRDSDVGIAVGADGHFIKESDIVYNELIGKGDTTAESDIKANAYAHVSLAYSLYRETKRRKIDLFAGVYLQWNTHAFREIDNEYESAHLNYPAADAKSEQRYAAITDVRVAPRFGVGRPVNAELIYRALEIERMLRKRYALKDTLSDKTLLQLTRAIASRERFRIEHDLAEKFYYQDLEQILVADSNVHRDKLDAYTIEKAEEVLYHNYPEMMDGLRFYVSLWEQIELSYAQEKVKRNGAEVHGTGSLSLDNRYELFDVHLVWGKLIWKNIFIRTEVEANFISTSSESNVAFVKTAFDDPQQHLDLSVFYLITNKLIAKAGCYRLPAFLVIPADIPQTIYASLDYVLEDDITLTLSFTKKQIKNKLYDEQFSLKLMYDL
ncbi:MAG: hypothetical protein GF398_11365 [Chitinivibrionales bacterium]|nr:hypothetical protein [Chitinivibrionales bacterium]